MHLDRDQFRIGVATSRMITAGIALAGMAKPHSLQGYAIRK